MNTQRAEDVADAVAVEALMTDVDDLLESVESAVDDLTWGLRRLGEDIPWRVSRALRTLDAALYAHGQ